MNIEDVRQYLIKTNQKFLKDSFKDLVISGITSIEEYDMLVNFD